MYWYEYKHGCGYEYESLGIKIHIVKECQMIYE